jgi:hypothetical protein
MRVLGCGIWFPSVAGGFDISWKVTVWVNSIGVGNVVVVVVTYENVEMKKKMIQNFSLTTRW